MGRKGTIITCVIVVCVFIVGIFIGMLTIKPEQKTSYDPADEWLWEMQVGKSKIFAELVEEAQKYIDSIAPTSGLRALPLVHECTERNIPIALTLAQGHVESHFGTQGLAKRTNSVWNVGAFDGADSITALNKYNNPNESTRDYVKKIDEEYLCGRSVEDLLSKFVNKHGQRYASDPNYESSLRIRYNDIVNNTRIEELQDKLIWYSLRLK